MSSEAIQVERLRHVYGTRVALDDVSFSVARGEMFGLLGPNGGGKTTLFKILSTLTPATSGAATVLGDAVRVAPAAVRRHLGVVFQHPSVDSSLNKVVLPPPLGPRKPKISPLAIENVTSLSASRSP